MDELLAIKSDAEELGLHSDILGEVVEVNYFLGSGSCYTAQLTNSYDWERFKHFIACLLHL